MKRKVITLSDTTFVITLPLDWIRKYDIKKGDYIDLSQINDDLLVSVDSIPLKKNIKIDISNLTERVIRWQLSALHKSGYDHIEILYANKDQEKLIYELMKNLFTGFNILSETANCLILRSIAKEDKQEFDAALRRAFRITLLMGNELLDCFKKREINEHIKEKELINNQLTNFCQRLINKHNYGGNKATFLYAIIWNLEKVCDNYKYIFDTINTIEDLIEPNILEVFELINEYLNDYYNLFYEFELTKLNKINQKQNLIKEKIKNIQKKDEILNHLQVLMTQITDFSASIIALNS
ncbi:hypothetical protein HOC35_02125 [Candidatus Woesearchaeota archaeon]|jgi:phosphate uptake regulator|nr:hypothetical protein [Candidatus Woesearchaeota archaeon]